MSEKCRCNDFESDLITSQDVNDRCAVTEDLIKDFKEEIVGDWKILLKCDQCDSRWVVEFPYSERQAGGPKCAYMLKSQDVKNVEDLNSLNYLTTSLLLNEQKTKILKQFIDDEEGPEQCRESGCSRLTTKFSVFCGEHHYLNLQKSSKV